MIIIIKNNIYFLNNLIWDDAFSKENENNLTQYEEKLKKIKQKTFQIIIITFIITTIFENRKVNVSDKNAFG